jgi:sugar-specific transcriptional regulator TrmB
MDTISNPTSPLNQSSNSGSGQATPSSARREIKSEAPESPYVQIFEKLGLNKNEAQIYELLIQTGPQGMKPILYHTKLKRGNAYYHLDNLTAKGLVKKQDLPGQTTKFAAKNPEQLGLLITKQKAAVFSAEEELVKNLPQLRSIYQLAAIKPTVKYFEGLEGAKQVVEDSLTSATEIYSYIDSEELNKQFPDLNKNFTEARARKGIKKKIIMVDSPFVRQHAKAFDPANTQIRVIPAPANFSTIMYIYDNTVSYISMEKGQIVSMIIEHPAIYRMHKTLFQTLWETTKAAN